MKRRNLISDINVVPYIDVMLVLLVIFMISAPLMVQGIQVNLPEASSEALPVKNNEPLIISIDQEGKIFLETESTKNQSLTLLELNSFVSKIFQASPNMQVVIRGDASVAYQRVMVVMAELQSAGASDIGLISQPSSAE
ncbi:MAG: protein TolR [Gammaproteobacteria bacterium]|jgi:biopolymer transport protein TolR|nr:protein TolR [Gammaproteobacteria bacterium]MBS65985.1 protein TolR [Gammaproteobacteria bacterium]|tara:strand:- start:290 stop:706 length:417 start_codon:yes stop_codon:yes gene_type:complete